MLADPSRMTTAQRFAEIAEIFAAGYQRLLVAECKAEDQPPIPRVRLAVLAPAEAPCGSNAQNPKSTESKA